MDGICSLLCNFPDPGSAVSKNIFSGGQKWPKTLFFLRFSFRGAIFSPVIFENMLETVQLFRRYYWPENISGHQMVLISKQGFIKIWKNACTEVLSASFTSHISSFNKEIDKVPLYNHFTREIHSENLKSIV